METKTAFDLNTAIQRWREHLGQSPCFRRENLDELEVHLRDAIAALRGTALSEEEAFLVATRRLGGASALEPEFAKVNGKEVWLNRLLWMLVGSLLLPLLHSCASTVADATVMGALLGFGYHFGQPGWMLPLVLFATANVLALAGFLAACWWAIRKKGRTFANIAVSLLRRPLFIPILVFAIGPLVLGCLRTGTQVLLVRWLPPQTFTGIYTGMGSASALFSLVVGIALAVLTVLLARRQLRPSTNS